LTRLATLLSALFLALPVGGTQSPPEPAASYLPPEIMPDVPRAYRYVIESAALTAGVPPRILAGVAFAESSFREAPPHPDPLDRGMFGLHESPAIHAERAGKWGEYDALDVADAARIAALYLAECYRAYDDEDMAICAYRQGIAGVRRDGAALWYAERVRGL